jgi:hypothetical protein
MLLFAQVNLYTICFEFFLRKLVNILRGGKQMREISPDVI